VIWSPSDLLSSGCLRATQVTACLTLYSSLTPLALSAWHACSTYIHMLIYTHSTQAGQPALPDTPLWRHLSVHANQPPTRPMWLAVIYMG
jgi:hypothetical protein